MTPASSSDQPTTLSPYRRRKRAWLLAIAVVGFVGGACQTYFALRRQHNPLDAPLVALYVFLVFGWYHADSDERGFRRGFVMNFLIVMLAAVGIPVYMMRTRGFARGLLGILLALLMLLGYIAAALLGGIAVMLPMHATL